MIACRRRPCNGFGRPFGNLAEPAQRGNRVKQPAAIADKRDAKVFQILSGELRQDFAVDPVLAKGRLNRSRPSFCSQAAMSMRYSVNDDR